MADPQEFKTPDGVPLLVLNQAEAAKAVGLSVKTFRLHCRPYVKRIDIGRRMLFPVSELEAWVERQARGL